MVRLLLLIIRVAAPQSRHEAAETKRIGRKRCRPRDVPTSLHSVQRDKDGGLTFLPAAPAVIDGEHWVPELSPDGFVGLFFRCAFFLRGDISYIISSYYR